MTANVLNDQSLCLKSVKYTGSIIWQRCADEFEEARIVKSLQDIITSYVLSSYPAFPHVWAKSFPYRAKALWMIRKTWSGAPDPYVRCSIEFYRSICSRGNFCQYQSALRMDHFMK